MITISVTQADIDLAKVELKDNNFTRSTSCPIAQAIKRVTGKRYIVTTAGAWSVQESGQNIFINNFVKHAIELFDQTGNMTPFEFEASL